MNISCAKFCSNQMESVENAGQNVIFTFMYNMAFTVMKL